MGNSEKGPKIPGRGRRTVELAGLLLAAAAAGGLGLLLLLGLGRALALRPREEVDGDLQYWDCTNIEPC